MGDSDVRDSDVRDSDVNDSDATTADSRRSPQRLGFGRLGFGRLGFGRLVFEILEFDRPLSCRQSWQGSERELCFVKISGNIAHARARLPAYRRADGDSIRR